MGTPTSFVEVARTQLSESLQGSSESLNGFPAQALLGHYLAALESGHAAAQRAAALACGVLSAWVARLSIEIAACQPSAGEICARLNQRLVNTRATLAFLHTRLLTLERLREERAPEPVHKRRPLIFNVEAVDKSIRR